MNLLVCVTIPNILNIQFYALFILIINLFFLRMHSVLVLGTFLLTRDE
jgi:hypothetical protein